METHVVISHDIPAPRNTGKGQRQEKDDRLLLHPIRRQNRLTARDKNPHWDQAVNRKANLMRVKFHAELASSRVSDLQV